MTLHILCSTNFRFPPRLFFLFFIFSALSISVLGQPVINSFSPQSGIIGSNVTIAGTNFSSTAANNIVYFGAVRATISAASATSLTVQVPIGATCQPITVTVNQLTAYSSKPFVVTFTGGGNISGFAFYERKEFATDLHPNGMVMADFDGDGKPDLATANNYSLLDSPASVSLLLNTSNSGITSFSPRVDLETGVQTYDIASGDIDGDGKPDIAYVSNGDKTLAVSRNISSSGILNFETPVKYSTGINPFAIAINDLDADGKPDILVANWLSNTISVYKNQTIGNNLSFLKLPDIPTALNPNDIAINDMNADGKPDLVVVNYGSRSFSVFLNTSTTGTVSFAAKTDITTGTDYPFSIALGDIDGDLKPDVVLSNNNVTITTPAIVSTSVFRNTGSGNLVSFATKVNLNGNGDTYNVAIHDLNGDGLLDIIVPQFNNSISVYQNGSSPGSLAFPLLSGFFAPSPYTPVAGDLDMDGMPDIAVTNFTLSIVSVLKNTLKTPRVAAFTPASGLNGTSVSIIGTNFNNITDVMFGETPAASYTVNSPTSITASVGTGSSGDVSVTNSFGIGRLAGFTFTGPPTITSFSPAVADSGITVTIRGTNFVNVTGVSFGGSPAVSYTIISPSMIEAVVGLGSSGNLSVTSTYGTASLGGMTVAAPTINNFSPTSATLGDTVTIIGSNFNSVKAVYFGTAAATSFQKISPTQIKAVVSGGASGAVSVQTVRTVNLPGFTYLFAPAPVINNFTPQAAVAGSTITINGSGFSTLANKNSVYFGGVKATVQSATPTSLVVTVPAGASFEEITVVNTNTGLSGISSLSFAVTLPVPATVDGNLLAKQFHSNGELLRPETGDLDGDGKAEIIYQQQSPQFRNEIVIRKNASTPGSLVFTDSIYIRIGEVAAAANLVGPVVVVDMDGDGRKDIVALNKQFSGVDSIVILRNTSSVGLISFAPKLSFRLRPGTNTFKLYVSDVDGDGRMDFVTDGGFLSLYRNVSTIGKLNFIPGQDIVIPGEIAGFADLNNDGLPEAIVIDGFNLVVMPNNSTKGSVSFGPSVTAYSNVYDHFITSISSGDLDGDNKPDLFLVNSANTAGSFALVKNTSSGNTFSFTSTDYPVTGKPYLGTMGDADGDGKPDIFTTSFDLPYQLTLYRNTSNAGSITIASRQDYPTPSYYFRVRPCDLDNDGRMDIIMGGRGIDIFRKASINAPAITVSGTLDLCLGDSVVLTSSAVTGNQWHKNAVPISGSNGQSLTVKEAGSYSVNTTAGNITSGLSLPANVTVKPLPITPVISLDGSNNLVSSAATGNQWYLSNSPILGATAQTYKPASSGLYKVQTTQNGCTSAFSTAFNYTLTAIEDLGNGRFINVIPNPVQDYLIVSFNLGVSPTVSVQVIGLDGKILIKKEQVKNNERIRCKELPAGIYFIRVINQREKVKVQFKIVKM